jgi:hypothetical protein
MIWQEVFRTTGTSYQAGRGTCWRFNQIKQGFMLTLLSECRFMEGQPHGSRKYISLHFLPFNQSKYFQHRDRHTLSRTERIGQTGGLGLSSNVRLLGMWLRRV